MKRTALVCAIALGACALSGGGALAGQVVTYPAPPGEKAFEDCAVQVDGKPVFVHAATVNRSAPDHPHVRNVRFIAAAPR